MVKFKKGDRVVLTHDYSYCNTIGKWFELRKGEIGMVVMFKDGWWHVDFGERVFVIFNDILELAP